MLDPEQVSGPSFLAPELRVCRIPRTEMPSTLASPQNCAGVICLETFFFFFLQRLIGQNRPERVRLAKLNPQMSINIVGGHEMLHQLS